MIHLRQIAFAVAVFVTFASIVAAPHAHAQTLEEVQSVGQWAAQFQRIVRSFITPLQRLPDPPGQSMTRAERLAWAATARQWAASAQVSFSNARADLERLPPSPPPFDSRTDRMRTAIESALPRVRESLDAGDRIASAYLALADAVERNQMDRVNSIRVTAIEAALVSTRLFQDTNAAQAAASAEGNPQGPLANSYAHSYAGWWAILNYRRDLMRNGQADRGAAADALALSAQQMRAAVAQGRTDLTTLQAQLSDPAVAASVDPALLPRLRAVASTFSASFLREDDIAGNFDAIVALLRGPGGGEALQTAIDEHIDAFSARDAQRLDDISRRNTIMTAP